MTTEKQIALGKKTAQISFIIGTAIFGIYFLTSNWQLLFVGYGFIIIAGIFNIIILILTLTKASKDSENRQKLLKTSGLMLLNIPVLFIYVWFAMLLIGNMRITFTNTTENKLTEINIIGCETEHIVKLEPKESKTVWVEITGDCSINIDYNENGEIKNEIVAGYVTRGMGQKMNHKIGGENHLEF
ncbi:hypothetical protein [Winogradskyella psychrotolerans]|uniref:hypothetical protein n=1 Tax=Winogradskyella psychrotolerans TaxID=1344585 RepID=UPI001C068C24|nr:hypothetical protein [Winogradskyella psychrotolerans]MBU2930167.1 hypothetical protein [Winogradskyella psychrotolerans]